MIRLSERHQRIHSRALDLAKTYHKAERELVEILIEVESSRLHKSLEYNSVFKYATKELALSDAVALMLIGIARAAKRFSLLRTAIAEEKLTPAKASRIIAHLTEQAAPQIIEFAIRHTYREIDHEMARRNPDLSVRESAKPISEHMMLLNAKVSKAGFANLQRAQSLLAQKGKSYQMGNAIEAALDVFLYKHDPTERAKRAKTAKEESNPFRPTRAKRDAALARDNGRCTHIERDGSRCNCDRWVEVHHIKKLSEGGTNELANLTTLCWFHHDLLHQKEFPI